MSGAIRLSRDTIEQLREPSFVTLLLVGVLLFALGGAFLVLGVAINTGPPAPYVTPTDKRLLIGISLGVMVVGVVLIRVAVRVVGW